LVAPVALALLAGLAFLSVCPPVRLSVFFAMTPIWPRGAVRSTTNRGSKKTRLS
jgi:hypothetical protein